MTDIIGNSQAAPRRVLLGLLLLAGPCTQPVPAEEGQRASLPTQHQVLRVGPDRTLKRPSQAARIARPGALITIDGGDYRGDVAVWRQDGLTLRGINGQARLHAAGNAAEGKAIWVIRGRDVQIDNIGFFGAKVPDRNGAGIRAEGLSLTIRNSLFGGNELGILTSNRPEATLRIESSRFVGNTTDYDRHGRLGHNIYVGRISRFELRDSLVTGARTGHQVKTRAGINRLIGNRIHDDNGAPGSSYLVDICEGGHALILRNHLIKGPHPENPAAIAFATEANRRTEDQSLRVIGNRFENRGLLGIFVHNRSHTPARLRDNRIDGLVRTLVGPGEHDSR